MDPWISDTSDPTDRTFQSLGPRLIGSRVTTGFLQLLGSLGSLVSFSICFFSRSVLSILSETQCLWDSKQTQMTKIRNLYIETYVPVACVDGCSNQWFNGLISWTTKVHFFVYQFLALLESTDQWSIFPNK